MTKPPEFRQSRLGIRTRFILGDARVAHSIADRSGEREFNVPYELLDFDDVSTLALPSAKPTMYMWAAGFPLGFFGLRIGYDHAMLGAITGILAFACIFIGILAKDLKWFTIRMDMLPSATGQQLRILHDDQHDAIIAALAAAQRRALEMKYAGVDRISVPGEHSLN